MDSKFQTFEQNPQAYIQPPRRKEIFDAVYGILKKEGIKSVLDVGCASGDFLYFLPDEISATGIDISSTLIDIAKGRNQKANVDFIKEDILAGLTLLRKKYECITILGTLHTFH